jgi:hypothetical protein
MLTRAALKKYFETNYKLFDYAKKTTAYANFAISML